MPRTTTTTRPKMPPTSIVYTINPKYTSRVVGKDRKNIEGIEEKHMVTISTRPKLPRIGGDHFVIVGESVDSVERARGVLDKMVARFAKYFDDLERKQFHD